MLRSVELTPTGEAAVEWLEPILYHAFNLVDLKITLRGSWVMPLTGIVVPQLQRLEIRNTKLPADAILKILSSSHASLTDLSLVQNTLTSGTWHDLLNRISTTLPSLATLTISLPTDEASSIVLPPNLQTVHLANTTIQPSTLLSLLSTSINSLFNLSLSAITLVPDATWRFTLPLLATSFPSLTTFTAHRLRDEVSRMSNNANPGLDFRDLKLADVGAEVRRGLVLTQKGAGDGRPVFEVRYSGEKMADALEWLGTGGRRYEPPVFRDDPL
jgi:hypothetical protein